MKKIIKSFLRILGFRDFSKIIFAYQVLKGDFVFQTNAFAYSWNNFLKPPLFREPLEQLTNGMDHESQAMAALLVQRFQTTLSSKPIFIGKDEFTQAELHDQKIQKAKLYALLSQFGLKDEYASVGPLCNDSGLVYLPEAVKATLANKVIIDGGAYVGQAALPFVKYNPSRIYCFEPVSKNFAVLTGHVARNGKREKITAVNKGLGHQRGKAQITIAGNSSTVTESLDPNSETIELETIDSFVASEKCGPVGLIKLDVEGFEMNVLKGAINTIRDHKPVLIISIYHRPEDFFFIKPFLEKEVPAYTFMIRKTNPFWLTYDTVLIGYLR